MRNSLLSLLIAGLVTLAGCQSTTTRPTIPNEYYSDVALDVALTEADVARGVYTYLATSPDGAEFLEALESTVSYNYEMFLSPEAMMERRAEKAAGIAPRPVPFVQMTEQWREEIDQGLTSLSGFLSVGGCSDKAVRWLVLELLRLMVMQIATNTSQGWADAQVLSGLQDEVWSDSRATERERECLRYGIRNIKSLAKIQS